MGAVSAYATAGGKRYRVRYRTPDRRQTDKRGFRTKREAELYLASVEVSKSRGEYVDPSASKITIGELGKAWLEIKRGSTKPSSFAALAGSWKTHVNPRWGDVRLADLTHTDVAHWVAQLRTGEGATQRRPLSASTVLRAYGILASAVDLAVRDRRINTNPARGLDGLPRKTQAERRYLDHGEVARLAAASGPNAGIVLVLSYCGLRWGELAALRVGDVDITRRRLQVRENAVLVGTAIHVGSPKTHERRSVPVPQFVMTALAGQLEGRDAADLLFPAPAGGHRRPPNSSVGKKSWWMTALRSAGLPLMGVHGLRHTAASLMISAGANVKGVQRALGHKSAAMTLDTYADLFEADLDAVAAALHEAAGAPNLERIECERQI